jgi:hypothetical protein
MKTIAAASSIVLVAFCLALDDPRATAAAQQTAQKPKPATGSTAAPSASVLDGLLAPVALYPDALLAQMLVCTANPGKVAVLQEWLASNTSLKGTELQDAATKAGFEPSFVAMALFPQVIDYMAGNIAWTKQLGEAFAADRSAVFASIQRLRAQAQKVGTLKTTAQQEVETKTTSSGEQVIVIEPANPQVVYVPQYNPQVVYTQPASTTVVIKEDDDSAEAVAAGLIGFTAGIALGAAFDNNYYYGPYGWGGGAYMYNDAWDDWYDHREDAREDWADHREDLYEERGEQRQNAQEQRTERTEARQENRPETQAQRTERQQNRQTNQSTRQANRTPEQQAQIDQKRSDATAARSSGSVSQESRGYSGTRSTQSTRQGSGSRDAFSGYSSGKSERAASQRGQRSRSSSRGGRR